MIPEEVNRPNMEIVPSVDLTKAFTTSQVSFVQFNKLYTMCRSCDVYLIEFLNVVGF